MKRIPRVKEQSHDKTGVYGGGSRYGDLSTPKTSPSAGRMKHTQGNTHNGDKRGTATIWMNCCNALERH